MFKFESFGKKPRIYKLDNLKGYSKKDSYLRLKSAEGLQPLDILKVLHATKLYRFQEHILINEIEGSNIEVKRNFNNRKSCPIAPQDELLLVGHLLV